MWWTAEIHHPDPLQGNYLYKKWPQILVEWNNHFISSWCLWVRNSKRADQDQLASTAEVYSLPGRPAVWGLESPGSSVTHTWHSMLVVSWDPSWGCGQNTYSRPLPVAWASSQQGSWAPKAVSGIRQSQANNLQPFTNWPQKSHSVPPPTIYPLSLCAQEWGDREWMPALPGRMAKFRKSVWDWKYCFDQFWKVQFATCTFL